VRIEGLWLRALAGILGWLGGRWIHRQRRLFGSRARPLTTQEHDDLAGFFDQELLASVRIRAVEQVSRPWFVRPLAWLGLPLDMDFRSAAGITFGDLILISGLDPGRAVPTTLLFHEMVHVLQYQHLGIDGFARVYVRGWLENGRAYLAIPLEQEAYAQEDRFRAGERFRVKTREALS